MTIQPWMFKLAGLVALLAGVWMHGHHVGAAGVMAEWKAQQLAASEQIRKDEHDNAITEIHRLDNFAAAQAKSEDRALPARSDLVSVQHSLTAIAAEAPASGCSADPRLAGLADLLREGAGLVEEGARHVDDLRDQRDALSH